MNIIKKIKENSYLGALTIVVASVWWFIPDAVDKTPRGKHKSESELYASVRYTNLSPIDVSQESISWGTTEPINYSKILSEIDGRVSEIFIKQGDEVKKGQIILNLDTQKLKKDKYYYEQLVKETKKKHEANLLLAKTYSVSDIQLLEAKTAYEGALSNLENTENEIRKSQMVAPFDGIVSNMNLVSGDLLSQNTMIAEISNISQIKVNVSIPEGYINKVKKGQTAKISVGKEKEINGEVTYVSRLANSGTHMFSAEIVSEPRDDLYSGGSAKAEIKLSSSRGYKIKTSSLTLNKDQVMGIKTLNDKNEVVFNKVEIVKTIDSELIILGPTGDIKLVTTGGEWVSNGEVVKATEDK